MTQIAVVIGSQRPQSLNRALAKALVKIGVPGFTFTEAAIADIPMFDQAVMEAGFPAEAERFKAALHAADGVLMLTPEHNRSISSVLKNAIDWASRPYGKSAFAGKPIAIAGASYGKIGTTAAQQHLRTILAAVGSPTMPGPECFIELTPGLVAEDGSVTNEGTRQFLEGYMDAFGKWVQKFK